MSLCDKCLKPRKCTKLEKAIVKGIDEYDSLCDECLPTLKAWYLAAESRGEAIGDLKQLGSYASSTYIVKFSSPGSEPKEPIVPTQIFEEPSAPKTQRSLIGKMIDWLFRG